MAAELAGVPITIIDLVNSMTGLKSSTDQAWIKIVKPGKTGIKRKTHYVYVNAKQHVMCFDGGPRMLEYVKRHNGHLVGVYNHLVTLKQLTEDVMTTLEEIENAHV